MQFTGRNEFAALVDGRIDSAKVAQTGNECQSIQDLSNADFSGVCIFDSEIAGGKRALDAIFNGCRLDDFVDICLVDDADIIFGGAPRARIDFSNDLFRHVFDHLVEIISKQVVE